MRPDLVAPGRKQLVGLKTKDPKVVLEEGAQIVADPKQPIPMKMIGHVTSSYWSENCGRSIALALVSTAASRMGETLYVPMPDGTIEVEVSGHGLLRPEGRPPQWLRLQRAPTGDPAQPHWRARASRRRRSACGAAARASAFRCAPRPLHCSAFQGAGRRPAGKAENLGAPGRAHALWLGPDEWLVIDETGDPLADCAGVKALHSAVGISHRNVAISVTGRPRPATISAGCPQDLSLDAFPVGACSRTILGKVEIVLLRTAKTHSASNAGAPSPTTCSPS